MIGLDVVAVLEGVLLVTPCGSMMIELDNEETRRLATSLRHPTPYHGSSSGLWLADLMERVGGSQYIWINMERGNLTLELDQAAWLADQLESALAENDAEFASLGEEEENRGELVCWLKDGF